MRKHGEQGFTLPELLISIVILGVVVAPLAAATVMGFRATNGVDQKVLGAAGRNLLATYLAPDVQSATQIARSDTKGCGGAGTVLEIQRGTSTVVAYVLQAYEGGSKLVRKQCDGAASVTSSATTQITSAAVTCDPTACAPPAGVTVALTLPDGSVSSISARQRISPTSP